MPCGKPGYSFTVAFFNGAIAAPSNEPEIEDSNDLDDRKWPIKLLVLSGGPEKSQKLILMPRNQNLGKYNTV
jgi:hypothetical protein